MMTQQGHFRPHLSFAGVVKFWFWLHVVTIAVMIIEPSTPAAVLGRYSRSSVIILVLFLAAAPVMWMTTRWLAVRVAQVSLPGWLYALLLGICVVGLAMGWALHVGPTVKYIVARLYVTAILLTVLFWALSRLSLPALPSVVLWGLGLAVIAGLVVAATTYPGLRWTDEGYTTNAVWTYAQTGRAQVTMFQPGVVTTYSLVVPVMAVWLRLVGFGLVAARLFIYLIGLVSLGLVFVTARRRFTFPAAWIAVLLGAFSLLNLNYIFRDIESMLWMAGAYALYGIAEKSRRTWFHLFVGLAVALSVDGHPVAYRFSIAFGVAYLFEWWLLLRQQRKFMIYWPVIWLLAGGLAGAGLYLGYYSLGDNATFAALRQDSPFVLNTPSGILDLLAGQLVEALRSIPILVGLAGLGAVVAIRHPDRFRRLLVFSTIVPVFVLAVFYPHFRQYYLMHHLPGLVLLVAVLFEDIAGSIPVDKRRQVLVAAAAIILLMPAGQLLDRAGTQQTQAYNPILALGAEVRPLVAHDQSLAGVDPLYFEFQDYPHFLDLTVAAGVARREGLTELEAWRRIAPDAVLYVENYPLQQHVAVLGDFLTQHEYQPVRCWDVERIGRVGLYLRVVPADVEVIKTCTRLPAD